MGLNLLEVRAAAALAACGCPAHGQLARRGGGAGGAATPRHAALALPWPCRRGRAPHPGRPVPKRAATCLLPTTGGQAAAALAGGGHTGRACAPGCAGLPGRPRLCAGSLAVQVGGAPGAARQLSRPAAWRRPCWRHRRRTTRRCPRLMVLAPTLGPEPDLTLSALNRACCLQHAHPGHNTRVRGPGAGPAARRGAAAGLHDRLRGATAAGRHLRCELRRCCGCVPQGAAEQPAQCLCRCGVHAVTASTAQRCGDQPALLLGSAHTTASLSQPALAPDVGLQGAMQRLLAMRQYSTWVTSASGTLMVAGGTYTLLSRLLPQ
jgi:hypothetical protein